MNEVIIKTLKGGDIVKYRYFFMRKQGKVTSISHDRATCIIGGRMIKTSNIYKILR